MTPSAAMQRLAVAPGVSASPRAAATMPRRVVGTVSPPSIRCRRRRRLKPITPIANQLPRRRPVTVARARGDGVIVIVGVSIFVVSVFVDVEVDGSTGAVDIHGHHILLFSRSAREGRERQRAKEKKKKKVSIRSSPRRSSLFFLLFFSFSSHSLPLPFFVTDPKKKKT